VAEDAVPKMKEGMEKLQQDMMAIGQAMYGNQAAPGAAPGAEGPAGAAGGAPGGSTSSGPAGGKGGDDVIDAEFTESDKPKDK
jgi:hypothetical protein